MPNDGGNGTGLGSILAAGAAAASGSSGSSSNASSDPYGLGSDNSLGVLMGYDPRRTTIGGHSNDPDYQSSNGGKPRLDYSQNVVTSASDLAAQFAIMSQTDPGGYAALQQQLALNGYYGSSNPGTGYTGKDQNAINDAMRAWYAVAQAFQAQGKPPPSFAEFIKNGTGPNGDGGGSHTGDGGSGGGGGGGGGATRAPLQIQLSDPVALRAQINTAAQSALGRDLTDEEQNKFVTAFQSKESAAQTAAYNGAGTFTQPDASSDAMAAVKEGNETEYQNQQQGQYVRAFAGMMGATF